MANPSNPRILKLAEALADVLPQDQMRRNTEVIAQRLASRLDLVTREEFDIQSKVLQRTRQKLQALEKQIEKLEAQS